LDDREPNKVLQGAKRFAQKRQMDADRKWSDLQKEKAQNKMISVARQEQGKIHRVREELWRMAINQKCFILGAESDRDANKVDWAHFDFMVETIKPLLWGQCTKPLDYLKLYWGAFYPYIDKVLNDYELCLLHWNDLCEEHDDIIANQADDVEARRFMEEFLIEKNLQGEYSEFKTKLETKIRKELQDRSKEKA